MSITLAAGNHGKSKAQIIKTSEENRIEREWKLLNAAALYICDKSPWRSLTNTNGYRNSNHRMNNKNVNYIQPEITCFSNCLHSHRRLPWESVRERKVKVFLQRFFRGFFISTLSLRTGFFPASVQLNSYLRKSKRASNTKVLGETTAANSHEIVTFRKLQVFFSPPSLSKPFLALVRTVDVCKLPFHSGFCSLLT